MQFLEVKKKISKREIYCSLVATFNMTSVLLTYIILVFNRDTKRIIKYLNNDSKAIEIPERKFICKKIQQTVKTLERKESISILKLMF